MSNVMTVRSVFIGLLVCVAVVTADILNRLFWKLPPFLTTHLPLGVFGLLIVVVLAANPLLGRLGRSRRMSPGELAVILGMALVSSSLASTGLMAHFLQLLSMPLQIGQANPGWRRYDVLSYVPSAMLVNGGRYDNSVMDGLITGLGREGRPIGLSDIPWRAWEAPLGFWLSLSILAAMAWIGLSLIVHRQWVYHERLRYPIAMFATSVMEAQSGHALGPIYRNRLFWAGSGVVLLVNLVNYLYLWFPRYGFRIPLSYDFSALLQRWPNLTQCFAGQFLPNPTIFPMALGFAYFLSTDIGFSLWTSHVAFGVTKLTLMGLGWAVGGSYLLSKWDTTARFGGFVGTAMILLYVGRHYYAQVARRAIRWGAGGDPSTATAARALRVFVLALAAAAVMLIRQGLDWPLAILTVLMLTIMFVVAARMSAEAGLFALRGGWTVLGILHGFSGGEALGVRNLAILGLTGVVLCGDTVDCLMPHVVNALKIADDARVRVRFAAGAMSLGYVAAVLVAVGFGLWAFYNYGFPDNKWANQDLPAMVFQAPQRAAAALTVTGSLQTVQGYGPLERLAHFQPVPRTVYWAMTGLGAVLLLSALRLRFTWWPLHPIFVLVWGSWYMGYYGMSILLGWAVKSVVTRLGGGRTYARLKPLMVGVIAADVLAAFLRLIVGAVSYSITGVRGPG